MASSFKVLDKYYDCSGRSTRREYWAVTLLIVVVGISILVWESESLQYGEVFGPGFTLYFMSTVMPSLAVSVRRLHDADFSGWWLLVGFVPVVGWVLQFIFFATEESPELNRFGPNPRVASSSELDMKD